MALSGDEADSEGGGLVGEGGRDMADLRSIGEEKWLSSWIHCMSV